ncbi:uncharacterized protein BDR25DRAFT_331015 [Lindgomyces ingoldianus]|uniref:Uncharacterized protein n=1 Tax=Lindgomyces ingoldianus TaxID=673940 RepID=A0ACB6REJ6_9PLEO|nr:uncharacterized protein BDR25DRAFT_331015 [Lindgomyces ingoldianus]KAF2477173.1 hypothetical protein BDR25DRAFT_331015 [Lindgomyces ingoldianus]
MGDIFKAASVTLAAHCARDDSEGFLLDAFAAPTAIEHQVQGHPIGICRPPNLELDVTNSRLSRRGWVLQERFLSTRTLHFTPGRIYFETTSGVFSEDGPSSGLLQAASARRRMYHGSSRPTFFSPLASPELRATFGLGGIGDASLITEQSHVTPLEWLDLVEMYSHCGLTKEKDKLIAILGMARKIHSRTGSSWCAGIWSDRICEGLLWLPKNADLLAPSASRALSWSWASWDGGIQYPTNVKWSKLHPRCTFISLHNPHDTRRKEEVAWLNGPGYLRVRGRLISLHGLYLGEAVQLGPGPPRKGPITEESHDLPRAPLQHFVHARRICAGSMSQTAGWIAFDSRGPGRMFDRSLRISLLITT